jgi:N-acyl homoserine lactone hydrolase
VDTAIVSHLHTGHIQRPGLKWRQVSLEPTDDPALAPFTESLDVMGDGSLMLLPAHDPTAAQRLLDS